MNGVCVYADGGLLYLCTWCAFVCVGGGGVWGGGGLEVLMLLAPVHMPGCSVLCTQGHHKTISPPTYSECECVWWGWGEIMLMGSCTVNTR